MLSSDSTLTLAFNSAALPAFTLFVLSLLLAIYVLMREGGNNTSLSFALLALTFATWFGGFSFMYLSADQATALFFANIGHLGTPLIPAVAYTFTTSMLLVHQQRWWLLGVGWALGVLFTILQQVNGFLFTDMYHYWYGFYPKYQWGSVLYLAYFYTYLLLCLGEYGLALYSYQQRDRYYYRAKLFLLAFLVGYTASVDIAPFYGLAIFPTGSLSIVAFIIIVTYIVVKYHLIDITTVFAVDKIIDNMIHPLLVVDQQYRIKIINPATVRVLGYTNHECMNKSLLDLLPQSSSEEPPKLIREIESNVTLKAYDSQLGTKEGKIIDFSISCSPLYDPKVNYIVGYVIIARDIREYKKMENRLHYLAEHDSLTGLLNRRGFFNAYHRQTKDAEGIQNALILLDINQFKMINDTMGHDKGDQLLQKFADFIAHLDQPFSICGRIGGDEFAFALLNTSQESTLSRVRNLIHQVQNTLFHVDKEHIRINICAGIALYPDHGTVLEQLIIHADRALYMAKHIGPNNFYLYSETESKTFKRELNIIQQVREGLGDNKLQLWGQPIYDLKHNKLVAYELLLRLVDDNGEVYSPAYFLKIAENYGLMGDINRYVLDKALRTLKLLDAKGFTGQVACNIGGSALMDMEFYNYFNHSIKQSGVDPKRVICEMTERVVITQIDYALTFIENAHNLGVQIALDDFGVGESSLNQIKSLPVDIIKVDGSFICNLKTSRVDYIVVRSIIELSQVMNIKTVAEYVEDSEIVRILRRLGFNYAQGYYYGKPEPLANGGEV